MSNEAISKDTTTTAHNWLGNIAEIHHHQNIFALAHVLKVRPSANHTVLHQYPIQGSHKKPPAPAKGLLKWDATHVRLPCSPKNLGPVIDADGKEIIKPRWKLIQQALQQPISNSQELQAAILFYNTKYANLWTFSALHEFFATELTESETREFFDDLLPRIIHLALRLPELIQTPIRLLLQGQTHAVTLTQQQISCLLANAFLCTFPRRNTQKRSSEYYTFPTINFSRLFQSTGLAVHEKIKCICHYFRRVCPSEQNINVTAPTGVVTFQRRSLNYTELPNWNDCESLFGTTAFCITSEGTIEDEGMGLLQVDFANKYLGGGVIGSGCVQEEIRFVICPELLVGKLFTECLCPNEALLVVGCERYSNYTGYANNFKWTGNHEDVTPYDASRRRLTHIVAIDAMSFQTTEQQYCKELMLRELNKAYVGFWHTLTMPAPGVATGNWGCGAFGGDAKLKALLQLMACTLTQRSLLYFTFGDTQLRDEVYRMYIFLTEEKVRVQDLWTTLCQFEKYKLAPAELYNYIYKCHRKTSESTTKTTSKTKLTLKEKRMDESRMPKLPFTAHADMDKDMDI